MTPSRIIDAMIAALEPLRFAPPVSDVYNPLVYARRCHDLYWERYGKPPKEVVFLGMNPGPFGMAQTGVPFGEVEAVRGWMGIEAPVGKPAVEHPKRPVEGFACRRSEVSGRRLWGWAQKRFGRAEAFFSRFFVANYCPLLFLEEGGRNRTPDKLPTAEAAPLYAACDRTLVATVAYLRPRLVIGVGKFAEDRARKALDGLAVGVGRITHPSPANPAANSGWERLVEAELAELGVRVSAA
jgi:single-strand selective monofunctional uracil DNA glycosylase